jgi:hypothetical protein
MVMHKTTVYSPDDLREALHRVASVSRRSEADLIREGIRLVTQEYSSPSPRLLLFHSGQPDLAMSVDEALDGFGER